MANHEGQEYEVTWGGTVVAGVVSADDETQIDETETSDFSTGTSKTFIPSRDASTAKLELNLIPDDTDQQAAMADWRAHTVDNLVIKPKVGTAGPVWTAECFATSIGAARPNGDLVTRSISFRVNGSATITQQTAV